MDNQIPSYFTDGYELVALVGPINKLSELINLSCAIGTAGCGVGLLAVQI